MAVDPRIVNVLIDEAPAITAFIQGIFAKKHPGEPVPTSEQVIAAYESLYQTDVARDEQLLRDNPDKP